MDVWLCEGDEIDAGGVWLEVPHTPGHTLGHLSLWEPEERVLILGDAAHADDVAWINPYREGAGAIGRAMESVEGLAGLEALWACSGHGPAVVEPERALYAPGSTSIKEKDERARGPTEPSGGHEVAERVRASFTRQGLMRSQAPQPTPPATEGS